MEQRNFDLLYLLNTCRDVDLSYLDLIISFTPVTNVHSHFLDFVSFIDLTIRQVADESTDMVWPRSDCNALNRLIKPICKSLLLFRNVFFFLKSIFQKDAVYCIKETECGHLLILFDIY